VPSGGRQWHDPALLLEVLKEGPGCTVGITGGASQDFLAHPHLERNQVRMEGACEVRISLEQPEQERFGVRVAHRDGAQTRTPWAFAGASRKASARGDSPVRGDSSTSGTATSKGRRKRDSSSRR